MVEFATALSVAERVGRVARWIFLRPSISIRPFSPGKDLNVWTFADGFDRERLFWTLQVNVRNGVAARCVAFAEVHQISPVVQARGVFALHWADVEYKFRTTGADPTDIGPEGRRLDCAFTFPSQPEPGCWLATTGAVTSPLHRGEDHLPPGEYVVRIIIRSETAGASAITLNLHSPAQWKDLRVSAGAV